MSAWANIGGTWRKGVFWENVGGTWRKLTPWLNVAGTWRKDPATSVSTLAVTAAPGGVNGAISRPAGGNAQTNETVATATGGTAPYEYSWTSNDGVMLPTAASAAATRFSAFVEAGDSLVDSFECLVTDAKGQTATATVAASVSNYGRQPNAQL